MFEMASWVTSSHLVNPDNEPEKYKELAQKIYSLAREMDCEDIIENNKSLGGFYPTLEFEENSDARKHIEKFEEDTFWAELISKLSARDVLKKYSVESLSDIEPNERIEALYEFEVKWEKEFNSFGLQRFGINALKSVK